MAQGKLEQAGEEMVVALEIAQRIKNPTQLWQTYVAAGELKEIQKRPDEAQHDYQAAAAVIQQIADSLTDQALRQTFLASSDVADVLLKSRPH